MASVPDIFGGPLKVDPKVALKPLTVKPLAPGPAHKAQYVIEIVGPRTVAAASVKTILDPRWRAALGEPEIFVMSETDDRWRPMEPGDQSPSYDSLALAWDFVSAQGSLSNAAAQNLLNVAEQVATPLARRAMPLPPPGDVESAVRAVETAAESLDIGVGLTMVPRAAPFPEKELWIACAALGLQVGPSGLFEWTVPGWEEPLLTLSSLGSKETFSLQAVQGGATHPGVSVGFRVARSPDPPAALGACLQIAKYFESRLGSTTLDDEDRPLDEAGKTQLSGYLSQALAAFRQVKIEPGSAAALKIFR